MMPPRHGKSSLVSEWFPVWYLGWNPTHRVILTSYEADYAAEWSRKVRDHLDEWGPTLFGTKVRGDVSSRSRWSVEGIGRDAGGGMYSAGAGGAITGKGANLLVIDDPIKNDQDARSDTFRAHQWDWLQSTALSRLEPDGVAVVIMTSWHLDDLGQRIQAGRLGGHPWDVIKLPAIAVEPEPDWPDGMGRVPGEALWPERFDVDALAVIKAQAGLYWWSSLYQQTPVPAEGAAFKREWFSVHAAPPDPAQVKRAIRFWDCAATPGGGDYTVGTLLLQTVDGAIWIADVIRVQLGPGDVDKLILSTAVLDAHVYGLRLEIREEEEGGSSGKGIIHARGQKLRAYDYAGRRATGPKEVRWINFARQAQVSGVHVVARPWLTAWFDELLTLGPASPHDDQADSASGAFNELELPAPTIREIPVAGYW